VIYLDASALVSLLVREVHSKAIRGFLRTEHPVLAVSDFAVAEFTAAIGARVRAAKLTVEQGQLLLHVFDAWSEASAIRPETAPADIRVATSFVRRFGLGLRVPDALHLAMCQRLGADLLTFDRRQAAGGHHLGIRIHPLSAPVPASVPEV
jgi:uncharacterized protein